MSTLTEPQTPEPPRRRKAKFRYGYGYRTVVRPDGKRYCQKFSLTVEDLLHPHHDVDKRVESVEHRRDGYYLEGAFETHLPTDAIMLSDHKIAWDDAEKLVHCPDHIVFRAPAERKRAGGVYYVQAEGAKPLLAVEIVSINRKTRKNDTVEKLREYQQVGVDVYVIVDTKYRNGIRIAARLLGYRQGASGYEEMPLDADGILWIDSMNLGMKIKGVQVVCCERNGVEIPDYQEVTRARAAAETVAQQEAAARAAAATVAQQEAAARAAAEERIRLLEELLRQRNAH